jgi:hypothetical protein
MTPFLANDFAASVEGVKRQIAETTGRIRSIQVRALLCRLVAWL